MMCLHGELKKIRIEKNNNSSIALTHLQYYRHIIANRLDNIIFPILCGKDKCVPL